MEEQKPKQKRARRRPRVEPVGAYAVMVKVTRGRKVETIYAEATEVANGCLVVLSMDGPPPLLSRFRYIPLGVNEIEVFSRPRQVQYQRPAPVAHDLPMGGYAVPTSGPQITPGPLELARQREAGRPVERRPAQSSQITERNADGVPVITAGFFDGSPT